MSHFFPLDDRSVENQTSSVDCLISLIITHLLPPPFESKPPLNAYTSSDSAVVIAYSFKQFMGVCTHS